MQAFKVYVAWTLHSLNSTHLKVLFFSVLEVVIFRAASALFPHHKIYTATLPN